MLEGIGVGPEYDRRVRRVACITALVIAAAVPAVADARQQIVATPPIVAFGKTLTVRGSGWPVIEFCSRRVRMSAAHLADSGSRSAPSASRTTGASCSRTSRARSKVGAGDWLVSARMRCESGKDGSAIYRRAIDLIRIGSAP